MPIPAALITSIAGSLMGGPVTKILDAYIKDTELRRKLEADPSRPRHLLTEPGMGYRFEP